MKDSNIPRLYKCAFRTDAENEVNTKVCKCPKITLELYHAGHEREVEVCRNYYAELFQREYAASWTYDYNTRVFESAARAKVEIIKEMFGYHICKDVDFPPGMYDFQKLNPNNKNLDILRPFWIGNSFYHLNTNRYIYMPFFYALIDKKCAMRYPLDWIFGAICKMGIDKAKLTFGNRNIQLIVKLSIEKMVECLESENVRYKKTAVKPVLERIRNLSGFRETEKYEIKVITALTEILGKLTIKTFKY